MQQFIDGVIGVFNDPVVLLPTPLGVEVLHGWQLRPGGVLYSLAVQLPYQAVMQLRILYVAPIAENPRIHVEPLQPVEEEEPWSGCLCEGVHSAPVVSPKCT